MTPR
ncbi:MAG: hypothetical protein EZS28_042253, partial [Streblomastix strix]|jgi:hypothetical protein